MRNVLARLSGRGILLLLVCAFLAVTLISLAGIGASVVVVESVQGSGSAINAAGSLRRLAHRAGSLVVAGSLGGRIGEPEIRDAIQQFEDTLGHPALQKVLDREPSSTFSAVYRGVRASWHARLRPRLLEVSLRAVTEQGAPERYDELLAEVDAFVAQINTLVAILAHDAEGRIEQLRTTLALALVMVVLVVLAALFVMHRRVFQPLANLRENAARIARGDFSVRSAYTGSDELGQVGEAFNAMAEELSAAYRTLEQRVEEKTAGLTRSNRALELLYHVIARLYHAPASPETYAETLRDIERTLNLTGSFVCVQAKHGGMATVLSSTLGACANRVMNDEECANCPGRDAPWAYRRDGDADVLEVPLRDAERLYGMLRLALPVGERLQVWQQTLLEAVSRHMGIALGISHQSERERLLALQEERSTIARELHDSLAQSLSYMKIQASLLAQPLADAARQDEVQAILADLRGGINSAYRQLRELLATFRLRMEGDFSSLLSSTVEEFRGRSDASIDLVVNLSHCHLNPNQEIHVLHIIREALSNATRHAQASRIGVALSSMPEGDVNILIEDDGRGVQPGDMTQSQHYGLTIMGERARGLGGDVAIGPGPQGGTRVVVRFNPSTGERRRKIIPVITST